MDVDSALADLVEDLKDVASLEIKAEPLDRALRTLGIDPELGAALDGARMAITFSDQSQYLEAVRTLKAADGVIALADLGWVASFPGEQTDHTQAPEFTIYFINLSGPVATDVDAKDYEDMVKAAQELGGATASVQLGEPGAVAYDKPDTKKD